MKSIFESIMKHMFYILPMFFIMTFIASPMKVYAGEEINVQGKTPRPGYHFELEDFKAGETIQINVDLNSLIRTSCIHTGGCTICKQPRTDCGVPHYGYLVYCRQCYQNFGVKVPLIYSETYGFISPIYYPSYAGYNNYSQYIKDVESGKCLPGPVVNGTEYSFKCYNCNGCNQHITWHHRHIKEVKNYYRVRFHADNVIGMMYDQTINYGENVSLNSNTYVKNYYKFKGWDTDPSADTVVYTNGSNVKNLTTVNNGLVHLYAVWEREEVSLNIDPNGGTYNGSTTAVSIIGKTNSTITLSTPVRSGYTFLGWQVIEGDGQVVSDTSFVQGSISSKIIAIWSSPLTLDTTSNRTANSNKGAVTALWKDSSYTSYITPIYKRHTAHSGSPSKVGGCYVQSGYGHQHTSSCYESHSADYCTHSGPVTYDSCGCSHQTHTYYCPICGNSFKTYTNYSGNCKKGHSLHDDTSNRCGCEKDVLVCTKTEQPIIVLGCGYNIGDIEKKNGQNVISAYTVNIDYKMYRKVHTVSSYSLLKTFASGSLTATTQNGLNQYTYIDNTANDITKPSPIYQVKVSSSGKNISASWDAASDLGTTYDYYVQSYNKGTSTVLKTSNYQSPAVLSGLKGYVYLVNTTENTTITSSSGCTFTTATSCNTTIPSTSGIYYLHIAAIDNAGNIGPTTSIICSSSFKQTVLHQKWDENNQSWVTYEQVEDLVKVGEIYLPQEKPMDFYEVVAEPNEYTVNGENTIIIKYQPKKYSVTYKDVYDDILLNISTKEYPYGTTVSGTDLGTNTGIGYYYPNYKYVSSTTATVTELGAEVYRYFEPTEYHIQYNINDGIFGTNHPTQVDYGDIFTIDNPSREGFTFVGWTITGMSNSTHMIGDLFTDVTSIEKVTATTFHNLTNKGSNTVTFTAIWMDEEKADLDYSLKTEDGEVYIEDTWTKQNVIITVKAEDETGIKNVTIDAKNPKQETVLRKDYATKNPSIEVSTVFGDIYEAGIYDGIITVQDNSDLANSKNTTNPAGVNITTKDYGVIKIDKTLPEGEIKYDIEENINEDIIITIEAEDKHSGLHETAYSWDKGLTWVDVNHITVETNVKDEVWVRDAVENIAIFPYEVLWIDKLTPNIETTIQTSNQTYTDNHLAKKTKKNTGKFEEKRNGIDLWSKTNPIIEWNISDIETEKYAASGIVSVKLYETDNVYTEDTKVQIGEIVLTKETNPNEVITLSHEVIAEGETYYQLYIKDKVGNETIINYEIRNDKSNVLVDDLNSSIKMASIEKMSNIDIFNKINNQEAFISEFHFSVYDANMTEFIAKDDKRDSSGVNRVYLYLYDALEENTVRNYLNNHFNENNLISLLPNNKGNLYDLTNSIENRINTTHSGNVFYGTYSAYIDTFDTYPYTTELRYALIVYDNANNRVVYTMKDGEIFENYSIKATIYSSEDEIYNIPTKDGVSNTPYFKTGDMGYVDIWTIGYVDSITFDFEDVGNESATSIIAGNMLKKYNLGTKDIAGYSRNISSEHSTSYDGKYGMVNGYHYANHYTYETDGWLDQGTLIRIPPSYDLESNLSTSIDNKDDTYIYQDHFAKIIANKNGRSRSFSAKYVLYSTDRAGIHYRITHE